MTSLGSGRSLFAQCGWMTCLMMLIVSSGASGVLAANHGSNTSFAPPVSITHASLTTAGVHPRTLPSSPHPGTVTAYELSTSGAFSEDPAVDYESFGIEPIINVFQTLISHNGTSTGSFPSDYVPDLATCVPGSLQCTQIYGNSLQNGDNYTFVINPNATFYDIYNGTTRSVYPVDVLFSLARDCLFSDYPYGNPGWIQCQALLPNGNPSWDAGLHYPYNSTPTNLFNAVVMNGSSCPALATHGCVTLDTQFSGQGPNWPEFLELLSNPFGGGIMDCSFAASVGGGLPGLPCTAKTDPTGLADTAWDTVETGLGPQGNDYSSNNASAPVANWANILRWSMVGSGPYYLSSITPGKNYTLKASPVWGGTTCAWAGCLPSTFPVKTVNVAWEANATAGQLALKSGQADMATIPVANYSSDLLPLMRSGNVSVALAPSYGEFLTNFNLYFSEPGAASLLNGTGYILHAPPNLFQDLAFRQFLVHAFPYGTVASQYNTVDGIPQYSLFGGAIPQHMGSYYPTNISWPFQDPTTPNPNSNASPYHWWAQVQQEEGIAAQACSPANPCVFPFASVQNDTSQNVIDRMWASNISKFSDGAVMPIVVNLPFFNIIVNSFQPSGTNPMPLYDSGWSPDYPDPTDYTNPLYSPYGSYPTGDALCESLEGAICGGTALNSSNYLNPCPAGYAWANASVTSNCQGSAYQNMTNLLGSAASNTNPAGRELLYNEAEHIAQQLGIFTANPGQTVNAFVLASWLDPNSMDVNPMIGGNGDVAWYDLQYWPTAPGYPVDFIESGLPVNTTWSVTLGQATNVNSSSTVHFASPNGTYSFAIANVSGYSVSPTFGNVIVNGASVTVPITFIPTTFPVSFTLSGPPAGVVWGVSLNGGVPQYSTGATISFSSSNGTYAYSIVAPSGYTCVPSSGYVTIAGSGVSQGIHCTAIPAGEYSVGIYETGLPPATNWSFTLGGNVEHSTGGSMFFTEPNGTIAFSAQPFQSYLPSPASGNITVNGSMSSLSVSYSWHPAGTYSVTFVESGLPTGTSWSVDLSGTTWYSSGTVLEIPETNGSYSYTAAPASGYSVSPSRGSVVVSGGNDFVYLTYTPPPTYLVTFTQSGLIRGTHWNVTLNGATLSSTGTAISFSEPNGTYSYSVGGPGGYSINPASGFVTVSGVPSNTVVNFTALGALYPVVFYESGLAAGMNWSVTYNGFSNFSTSGSIIFEDPNGTFGYTAGTVPGYTAHPTSGTLTVNGSSAGTTIIYVRNPQNFTAIFVESGLPSGTSWSVTFAGTTYGSNQPYINFSMANGTYGYIIGSVPGYAASPSSGNVYINGANVRVNITYVATPPGTYLVSFNETGLPTGTHWNVTLNGSVNSSTGSSIAFVERNGSYTFSLGNVPGYTANVTSGSLTVSGRSVYRTISFTANTAPTYIIYFNETGLPSGTAWNVTFNGIFDSSTFSIITFVEPNGSYNFTVGHETGYTATPSSGTVTVNGRAANRTITFSIAPPVLYSVVFYESGLPTGTYWNITYHGVTNSSTTTSILFYEPNGTYAYTAGVVPGFSAGPPSGTLSVNGGPSGTTIIYTAIPKGSYAVTFTEIGLPTGTLWNVTLNGSFSSSTGNTIAYTMSNGTYNFSLGIVSGYTPSPTHGTLTVIGQSVNQTITFTTTVYTYTFTETGLLTGTLWNVTVQGVLHFSTSNTVSFTEPNGTYAYSVGVVSGYMPSPTSGTLTVRGAGSGPTITFSPVYYNVTFTESGLPTGTMWNATLNGIQRSSTSFAIVFSEANGTYSYSVGPVPGYTASPSSGQVKVNGVSVTVPITFTVVTYTVSFTESGLPAGTTWNVTLNSVKHQAVSTMISFIAPNGTYTYALGIVPGYTPSPASGSLTVNGAAVNQPIVFTLATYTVNFSETGLPTGTSWSVTLNGGKLSSTSSSILFSETNGTYSYSVGSVPGYTASPSSGQVKVNGSSITVQVTFTLVTYTVSFTESGLPAGTAWNVTLNGVKHQAVSTVISFLVPNGTYSYVLGIVPGYTPSPASGSLTVNGAAVNQPISFSPKTYTVTFSETGLPTGTSWNVTLAGTPRSSTSSTITFVEGNGTLGFTIGGVPGYSATPASGSITVSGSNTGQTITFTALPPTSYPVTFDETGLPGGTSWNVTLGGVTHVSTGTSIVFSEVNGTYNFSVGPVSGYATSPASGSVTVSGTGISRTITFTAIPPGKFSVTFSETGLAVGTTWSVTLGSVNLTSGGSAITFVEVNGTYTFNVAAVAGYSASPSSGVVTVSGTNVTKVVSFSPLPVGSYLVTFDETGLPTGTTWNVTLNGTSRSSVGSAISFTERNGSYGFTVTRVSGYLATPSNGSVSVTGSPVTRTITFTPAPPATYSVTFSEHGLPSGTLWSVTLNGVSRSSSGSAIIFNEVNGSYAYSVGSVAGYSRNPSSGTVTVNGASTGATVSFTKLTTTFAVIFNESGLLPGTAWSVMLNNSTQSSTNNLIQFAEANGTYGFTVHSISRFLAVPSSGQITVRGAPANQSINFMPAPPPQFPVVFYATGLSPGTAWSVTMGGFRQTSTTSSITFSEGNGTYTYSVGAPSGYAASPSSGTVKVSGIQQTINLSFAPVSNTNSPGTTFLGMPWEEASILIGGLLVAIVVAVIVMAWLRRRSPPEPSVSAPTQPANNPPPPPPPPPPPQMSNEAEPDEASESDT